MGTLWNRSSSLEWDNNAALADGALAYFYEAGTSTPKPVYQDGAEGTRHEDPVEADGGRWPAVFIPFGSYKVIIKTSGGTTLFTADEVPNPEPFDDTFELDETAIYNTGDYIFTGKNGIRSGAVRCNGRTIGDASSGATERANADCADLFAYICNNYLNAQCAIYDSGGVASTRGATPAADFAAHKRIAVPDHRGATLVGFDDMGNTAASLLGSAPVVSGSAILAGSIIGANTHTILEAQLPSHTHSFSATTGAGSAHTHAVTGNTAAEAAHTHTGTTGDQLATHTHVYQTATTKVGQATGFASAGGSIWCGADTAATTTSDAGQGHQHSITTNAGSSHLHAISLTSASESAHTHSVSGTSGSTGSGTAHNVVSRAIPINVLMKL